MSIHVCGKAVFTLPDYNIENQKRVPVNPDLTNYYTYSDLINYLYNELDLCKNIYSYNKSNYLEFKIKELDTLIGYYQYQRDEFLKNNKRYRGEL